jgi:hypothetical protein
MGQGQPRINQAGNHTSMTYKDGGPLPFNLVMYLILILILLYKDQDHLSNYKQHLKIEQALIDCKFKVPASTGLSR